MKLRFVLLVAALLAWTVVQGRPKPGTTNKHNQDLDGIGSDLDDFLRHRDENNNRQRESNTVYSSRNFFSESGRRGSAAAVQPSGVAMLAGLCVWLVARS